MDTRHLIGYLIMAAVVVALVAARVFAVRARRRERRMAAKPIQIVPDSSTD
jgi:hypothetical protein